jgi:hypothetical protein
MIVSTKYHWNISFKNKLPWKYVVKNARSVTHFVWQTFFQWISRVCQIKKNKYETIVQLFYSSGNHWCLVMIYKNKMVTLKNLILTYIGMKNIIILKRKCHVEINVVFLEEILKLYDVCFMKNIFISPWTCLYRFDLHIIIRWPENVRRVNKIWLHCGHFIHCYILLNFVLFFSC